MTIAEAITQPTASVIILAEMTALAWLRAWIVDGTLTNTYTIALAHEPEAVTSDGATALIQRSTAADVNSNAGSWYWDGATLWVRAYASNIYALTITARLRFRVSNQEKILDGRYWEARLQGSPQISQRIEAVFGGVGQIGGGTLNLNNADGYFDDLQDLRWDAGDVTLKIGIDLPRRTMAFADYETLATWSIVGWQRNLITGTFELKLKEPKARVKSKLPLDLFNRDDYPNLDETFLGTPIPLAYGTIYGAKPVLIDPGAKRFKVAGHAIRSFDGVRLLKERNESVTRTTTGAVGWQNHSGRVWRYYLAGETFKAVTFEGTLLTRKDNVADVLANNGTWTDSENYVYVNPQTAETFAGGKTLILTSEKTLNDYQTANFASVDLSAGEFTLGDDWAVGMEVSVDFRGKVSAGNLWLDNTADIVADLLSVVGETNLDAASFATARARLSVGIDENGAEVNSRSPSLYLTRQTELVELLGEIAATAGAYLYSDATGRYYFGVFEPVASDSLPIVNADEVIDFEEENEAGDRFSQISANYATREQDKYSQVLTASVDANQFAAGQTNPVTKTADLSFSQARDVRDWSARTLCIEGAPLKLYQLVMPWRGFQWKPGQQLLVRYAAKSIDAVLEIIEVGIDLTNKTTRLLLGNLRGFADAGGFWAGALEALPTRFAGLTGYGAGSLVWNASWAPEIKRWARQNVGYWTDDNGFADPTDPESFLASTWT